MKISLLNFNRKRQTVATQIAKKTTTKKKIESLRFRRENATEGKESYTEIDNERDQETEERTSDRGIKTVREL